MQQVALRPPPRHPSRNISSVQQVSARPLEPCENASLRSHPPTLPIPRANPPKSAQNSSVLSRNQTARQAKVFDDLGKHRSATHLMDLLAPAVDVLDSNASAKKFLGSTRVRAVRAAAALNHLKRLQHSLSNATERQRLESQFRTFARAVEEGMDLLEGKDISLALNAVGTRGGYDSLFNSASSRLSALYHDCAICEKAQAGLRAESSLVGSEALSAAVCQACPHNGRTIALALNALSKVGLRTESMLNDVAAVILRLTPEKGLQGQNVGLILNSFANLKYVNVKVMSHLCDSVLLFNQSQIDAQAVSNIVNALSKLNFTEQRVMRHLSAVLQSLPKASISSQSIANIIDAYARHEAHDAGLFRFLSDCAMQQPSDSYSAQAIASIVGGLARAGVHDPPLLRYLSIAAQRKGPGQLSPQTVCGIANAYARGRAEDPRLVRHLAAAALAMHTKDLRELAGLASTFSRLPQHAAEGGSAATSELFAHLRQLVLRRRDHEITGQEMSETSGAPLTPSSPGASPPSNPSSLHAPPRGGPPHSAEASAPPLGLTAAGEASGQDLAMLLSGFARTGQLDTELLAYLSQLVRRLPPLGVQDAGVMMSAGGKGRRGHRGLSGAAELQGLSLQDVGVMFHALARPGVPSDHTLVAHLASAAEQALDATVASDGGGVCVLALTLAGAARLWEVGRWHTSVRFLVALAARLRDSSDPHASPADVLNALSAAARLTAPPRPHPPSPAGEEWQADLGQDREGLGVEEGLDVGVSGGGLVAPLKASDLGALTGKFRGYVLRWCAEGMTGGAPDLAQLCGLLGLMGRLGMLPADGALRGALLPALTLAVRQIHDELSATGSLGRRTMGREREVNGQPAMSQAAAAAAAAVAAKTAAHRLASAADALAAAQGGSVDAEWDEAWVAMGSAVRVLPQGAMDGASLATLLRAYSRAGRADAHVFDHCRRVLMLEVHDPLHMLACTSA